MSRQSQKVKENYRLKLNNLKFKNHGSKKDKTEREKKNLS